MSSSNLGVFHGTRLADNRARLSWIGAALVLGWTALSLSGCGAEEESDNTPPDPIINAVKSQGKYRFSVTDTLSIEFDEKIDTSKIAIAISPSQGTEFRFKGQSKLLIYGTLKTSGTSHFTINSPFSVTLAGLKDLAGNGTATISESFTPFVWTDREFVDSTFNSYDSLFATDSTWIDGTPHSDSMVAEGVLDSKVNFGSEDYQDYKIIKLFAPDTLNLILNSAKSMNTTMMISGPFAENDLDKTLLGYDFNKSFHIDSTRSTGAAFHKFVATFDNHDALLGSPAAPGIYVIRVAIPRNYEGFYRLGLKLNKRKR
ncbi:MAG: Ig-like domain-containing protein [Fibrobacterota bacterium]|nr:Ig-like domain-containing protein [Fibrobacterota bacterium]